MIYPHAIRLAGPWEIVVLRADSDEPTGSASHRVQLPLDCGALLGEDFRGHVGFRRRFNRPTNLDPQEAVWLVIESRDVLGQVGLNGHALGVIHGAIALAEFDVTSQLTTHNEIMIDVEHSGSINSVRLEIRRRLMVDSEVESP